jgi:purine-cytosine permease-like protein
LSKSSGVSSAAVRVLLLVLMAFLLLIGQFLFLLFYVPIVGWYLWRDQDRIKQLEKKVEALENPYGKKPDQK